MYRLANLVGFPPIDLSQQSYDNVYMSCLSFKTFCIELYADHKSMPSNEVFKLFESKGILKMLDDDYDILHGHGFEYVIHEIDQIIDACKNAQREAVSLDKGQHGKSPNNSNCNQKGKFALANLAGEGDL